MKNKKIAALILFVIATISLSFTFSGRKTKASVSAQKIEQKEAATEPLGGFVSESGL